jgi:hypothetical protein
MSDEVCTACGKPIEPGDWVQLEFALDGPRRGPYHHSCLQLLAEQTVLRHRREAEEARRQRVRDKNLAAFRERMKSSNDD